MRINTLLTMVLVYSILSLSGCRDEESSCIVPDSWQSGQEVSSASSELRSEFAKDIEAAVALDSKRLVQGNATGLLEVRRVFEKYEDKSFKLSEKCFEDFMNKRASICAQYSLLAENKLSGDRILQLEQELLQSIKELGSICRGSRPIIDTIQGPPLADPEQQLNEKMRIYEPKVVVLQDRVDGIRDEQKIIGITLIENYKFVLGFMKDDLIRLKKAEIDTAHFFGRLKAHGDTLENYIKRVEQL